MNVKRSIPALLLLAATLAALLSFPAMAMTPAVSARHAILLDGNTGEILFEKDADTPAPMASTTKIMTALAVLSCLSPSDAVCVPKEAVGIEGTSAYLKEGEIFSVADLLHALLLQSANDAAVALALTADGSVAAFAERMNRLAREIGLKSSHFENPHGLHSETHYTTARDLATLTAYAMHIPAFSEIVSKRIYTCHSSLSRHTFANHNKLLHMSKDAVGVKTGFTKDSGRCLVGAAQRDGALLISVTLRAPDDWRDHLNLWRFGFSLLGIPPREEAR